jgi:antitoxin MazE
MKATIKKWGNSLALRIPKPLAAEVGLEADSPIELSLKNGKLLISPVRKQKVQLEDLLEQVTPENIHREVDTGPAVGGEIW